jgi:hypothetical protein
VAGIYRERHPEHTAVYRVLFYYFERFLRAYESRFDKESGRFRPVIQTATCLDLTPGVMAAIQTFGDRINFHPHIHVLITEGGTATDGAFQHVRHFHDEVIQEIFTREVFSMLLWQKLRGEYL